MKLIRPIYVERWIGSGVSRGTGPGFCPDRARGRQKSARKASLPEGLKTGERVTSGALSSGESGPRETRNERGTVGRRT